MIFPLVFYLSDWVAVVVVVVVVVVVIVVARLSLRRGSEFPLA